MALDFKSHYNMNALKVCVKFTNTTSVIIVQLKQSSLLSSPSKTDVNQYVYKQVKLPSITNVKQIQAQLYHSNMLKFEVPLYS
ncbi:unnamed protein product [Didymodactylos carnosus]|uniref:Uncharacterized protein n=1 Tax=Didymodactylos carnosus TaxID=1234261 RepID=A0A814W7K0_9BILA|nr:unnamed protein product [Didymodactylos carnosus]CAF1198523.1 unnamed protein product [Didymodactylos carnosus]CAF3570524.1 unnamed protein product [Didymodactylos carnosus]CAF3963133.1 unnamed protein product [Didymodactylos carnosus]